MTTDTPPTTSSLLQTFHWKNCLIQALYRDFETRSDLFEGFLVVCHDHESVTHLYNGIASWGDVPLVAADQNDERSLREAQLYHFFACRFRSGRYSKLCELAFHIL